MGVKQVLESISVTARRHGDKLTEHASEIQELRVDLQSLSCSNVSLSRESLNQGESLLHLERQKDDLGQRLTELREEMARHIGKLAIRVEMCGSRGSMDGAFGM